MKRNVAVLESIRELNDMFYETGDITKTEYERTKKEFPLPGERVDNANKGVEEVFHSAATEIAQLFSGTATNSSAHTLSMAR